MQLCLVPKLKMIVTSLDNCWQLPDISHQLSHGDRYWQLFGFINIRTNYKLLMDPVFILGVHYNECCSLNSSQLKLVNAVHIQKVKNKSQITIKVVFKMKAS